MCSLGQVLAEMPLHQLGAATGLQGCLEGETKNSKWFSLEDVSFCVLLNNYL